MWIAVAGWRCRRSRGADSWLRGRVVGPERCRGPMTGTWCVGYSIRFGSPRAMRSTRSSLVTATSGLWVELDDGRRLWLRAGRLRIDWRKQRRRRTRRSLPIAGLRAEERLLRAGDGVALRLAVAMRERLNASPYRSPPADRLTAEEADLVPM